MTNSPRRLLLPLVALVPILSAATIIVVLVNGMSWYAGLALFYVSLAVAQVGYLGLLLLEEQWRDQALDAPLQRQARP
jgi:hypothetical protein